MGALYKRIFSGVAIVSALLFVVSALMLFADGGEVSADGSGIALYILIVSGILSIVYAVGVIMDRPSFVKTLSGVFAAITGLVFMVVPFMGGSAGTVLAVASVIAAVTIIADMLALWVSRVYGAMYVAAVLAAVDIAMGILYFAGSTQATYHAIALIAFGVWLAMSAYVFGFVSVEAAVKTREVKADPQAKKADKPQAQNRKATKKAKKPEKKVKSPAPKEVPKAEEPKADEPKADAPGDVSGEAVQAEKPKPKAAPRPVELPKKPEKKVESPAPKEEPREAPKADAPKAEEPKAESSKPAEPQKPPAKSMDDFMKKLMSSENANRAKREAPVVKEEPREAPKADAPKAEEPEVHVEPEVPEQPEVAPQVPEEKPSEESEVVEPEVPVETGEIQLEEPVSEIEDEPEPVEEVVEERGTHPGGARGRSCG